MFLWALVATFALCELMSLLSNIHLYTIHYYKALHPKSDPLLWIPQQHGFRKVSCANYFWRLCCWSLIALASQTLVGYVYLVWLFFDLNRRAHAIHYQYVSKYREQYPQNRRALIPYLF